MIKTTKLFPILGLCWLCNAFAADPFNGANYNVTSRDSLGPYEKTVIYTYPANPCGTLMTEYSSRGSVGLGRGPVYKRMLKKCQEEDSNSYPDDYSVRTYACKNEITRKAILGRATFAFQCINLH